ncbi:hypothetical protein AA0119_g13597, partial [Alternaria tenuissima]
KLKELKRAAQPSPSDGTSQSEMNEETLTATVPPDASVHEASNEVDSVEDERRRPDAASAPLTPLEHIASIEQSIDALLASVNDPCVQKSLQGPIKRIDLKHRDLLSRVQRTETTPVQQEARIVPSIQYPPYELAVSRGRARNMTAESIRSLTRQIYAFRTQHVPMTEIKHMTAELQRARVQAS